MAMRAVLLLTLATVMPTTEIPCVVDTHLERECTERTVHATRTHHAPKSRNCLRSFPHTVTADAETGGRRNRAVNHHAALRQINWQLARDRFNFEQDASVWLESIDEEVNP